MTPANEPRLMVTGASGRLGSAVVRYLAAAGVRNVVAASRRPEKLSLPAGFETRQIDFDDADSLVPAFTGIDRALIISTDRIDIPGLRIKQHSSAVAAAHEAGVTHLLYTSMLNPDRSQIAFSADHLETEMAIALTGLDFTILRVSLYTNNLPGIVAGALQSGRWSTSARDGRINYVPRDDVARAAAAALVKRTGVRERLDITGPEPLSVSQIAAIAAKLGASPIKVVQETDKQRAETARASGVPEPFVQLIVATDADIRAGHFDVSSTAVEDLTGSPATSVEAFLAANKINWQP